MTRNEKIKHIESLCEDFTKSQGIKAKLVWTGKNGHLIEVGDPTKKTGHFQMFESYDISRTAGFLTGLLDAEYYQEKVRRAKEEKQ